jgi:phosphoribosylformylglycinamidine synthase
VTASGTVRVLRDGETVGEVPVGALVDGCPLYDLEPAAPGAWTYGNVARVEPGADAAELLTALLASPNVASKRWAFEQYDSIVGSRTVRRPESADAAVLSVPEAGGAIAVSIDGNGRRVACDPRRGTIDAVLECAQNLACVGAEPLGLTNCLNFGNPEKPLPAWQLAEAVSGLAEACEALGVPVVGGNVSLYNEGTDGPIYPTPVVGMVGELPDPARSAGSAFTRAGDAIAIAGPFAPSLAGSELAKLRGELDLGLPESDIDAVAAACAGLRAAVRAGAVSSAHDISDGGLACAVAEAALGAGVGCRLDLDPLVELRGCSGETALFGEGSGGFVLSGPRADLEGLDSDALQVLIVGEVGGDAIAIEAAEQSLTVRLADAQTAWSSLAERAEAPA